MRSRSPPPIGSARHVCREGHTVGLYLNGGTYRDLNVIFDNLALGADQDPPDKLRDLPFVVLAVFGPAWAKAW